MSSSPWSDRGSSLYIYVACTSGELRTTAIFCLDVYNIYLTLHLVSRHFPPSNCTGFLLSDIGVIGVLIAPYSVSAPAVTPFFACPFIWVGCHGDIPIGGCCSSVLIPCALTSIIGLTIFCIACIGASLQGETDNQRNLVKIISLLFVIVLVTFYGRE